MPANNEITVREAARYIQTYSLKYHLQKWSETANRGLPVDLDTDVTTLMFSVFDEDGVPIIELTSAVDTEIDITDPDEGICQVIFGINTETFAGTHTFEFRAVMSDDAIIHIDAGTFIIERSYLGSGA